MTSETQFERAVRYLLGQLETAAALDFERDLGKSRELREALREAEDTLSALALTVPPRTPPADGWDRIEERLHTDGAAPRKPSSPRWYQLRVPVSWAAGLALAASLGIFAVQLFGPTGTAVEDQRAAERAALAQSVSRLEAENIRLQREAADAEERLRRTSTRASESDAAVREYVQLLQDRLSEYYVALEEANRELTEALQNRPLVASSAAQVRPGEANIRILELVPPGDEPSQGLDEVALITSLADALVPLLAEDLERQRDDLSNILNSSKGLKTTGGALSTGTESLEEGPEAANGAASEEVPVYGPEIPPDLVDRVRPELDPILEEAEERSPSMKVLQIDQGDGNPVVIVFGEHLPADDYELVVRDEAFQSSFTFPVDSSGRTFTVIPAEALGGGRILETSSLQLRIVGSETNLLQSMDGLEPQAPARVDR